MRVAWFNPFAGIAGDMALGGLIDAGADPNAIEAACRSLGYPGWTMSHQRVDRAGIAATHVRVEVASQHHDRRAGDIMDTIAGAGLVPRSAERALAVFRLLAQAEGALHGVAADDVHFHEIGAVDSIIDIVGAAVALELLGIDEVSCGPVAVGVGIINAAHGVLPNPAPAVLRVLQGAPLRGVDVAMELTTPTGAALVAALAQRFGALPDCVVSASGYGAGTRNPPGRPNVVQVVVGETSPGEGPPAGLGNSPLGTTETIWRLETNLDDVTPETVGYVLGRLLEAGALDAWTTPATMKKSRPGLVLSALCTPTDAADLAQLIARETASLGIRFAPVQRWVAPRQMVTVDVGGWQVRVKIGPHRAKAEHDDVAAAAAGLDLPLRQVAETAEHQARSQAPN